MQKSTNLKILSATAAVLLAATIVMQPAVAGSAIVPQAQSTATPKPKATSTPVAKTAATPAAKATVKATPDGGIIVQPISKTTPSSPTAQR